MVCWLMMPGCMMTIRIEDGKRRVDSNFDWGTSQGDSNDGVGLEDQVNHNPPFSPEPQIDILPDLEPIKQLQLPNSNSIGMPTLSQNDIGYGMTPRCNGNIISWSGF